MATIAAILAGNLISGIGQGVVGAFQEQTRQNEWNKNYKFKEDQFKWQKEYQQQQLGLQSRGQDMNLMSQFGTSGIQAGGNLIGSLLQYKTAQDQLGWQQELNSQKRQDLTNDGLPMSYLHVGGTRGIPNIPMVMNQGFGRSTTNTMQFANQGNQPMSQTFSGQSTQTKLEKAWGNEPNKWEAPGATLSLD